jgi:hypothetical protein
MWIVVAQQGCERGEVANEVADDDAPPCCFRSRQAEGDVCGG